MNSNRSFGSLAVLSGLLFLIAVKSPAQEATYSEEAEQTFTTALGAFERGDYRGAETGFDAVVRQFPESQRTTAAMIMRAKALLNLSESYEASKVIRAFLGKYPSSRYVADATYLQAKIYFLIERFDEARTAVFRAWRSLPPTPPASLRNEILVLVDSILANHTPLPALYTQLQAENVPDERGRIWLHIAAREIARGEVHAAALALDSISSSYTLAVPQDVIVGLRMKMSNASSVKIGLLLPLMHDSPPSGMKEVGNDVYNGILAAFDYMTTHPGLVRIAIETRDTKRDVQTATEQARLFAADPSIIGIVGPVFSTTTNAAALIAGAHRVPLITPTANQNGIAAVGPTVFQANPDYEQRGRAMARYAVGTLGARILGVLAPSDTYAKALADAFIKEADALGAPVIAAEWYQKGASDLRSQLTNIRRAGGRVNTEPRLSFAGKLSRDDVMKLVRLGVSPQRIDSLLAKGAIVPARSLLGPRSKVLLDSIGVSPYYDDSPSDSLQSEISSIQALYCPISSPDEIGMVASQIVYHNVRTQVLGSGEWNSLPDLEANRRYCTGVQFESDSYIDTASATYRDFVTAYQARFRKMPEKNALYGYDAARMVFDLVENGATSREALVHALENTRDYTGVKGRIEFSGRRVDCWMHVLEYTPEGIRHVKEIDGAR